MLLISTITIITAISTLFLTLQLTITPINATAVIIIITIIIRVDIVSFLNTFTTVTSTVTQVIEPSNKAKTCRAGQPGNRVIAKNHAGF